jgi:hypothetical protein
MMMAGRFGPNLGDARCFRTLITVMAAIVVSGFVVQLALGNSSALKRNAAMMEPGARSNSDRPFLSGKEIALERHGGGPDGAGVLGGF